MPCLMDAETKAYVRDRTGNRCEYCRIHQRHYIITFHIEHIVARQHRGSDDTSKWRFRTLRTFTGFVEFYHDVHYYSRTELLTEQLTVPSVLPPLTRVVSDVIICV